MASTTSAVEAQLRPVQRGPSAQLFLGLPEENTSALSLPGFQSKPDDLDRVSRPRPPLSSRPSKVEKLTNPLSPLGRATTTPAQREQQRQNEGDRTDALWAEMQTTLAEVEISAARGTHFFGPKHAAAIEELRTAQVALAQSWARSEADDAADAGQPGESSRSSNKSPGASMDERTSGGETRGEKGAAAGGMQEETEGDIVMARRRREANEKYFWKVKQGVLDVVGRLEEVAVAMGKVERESREIWSDSSESVGLTTEADDEG